MSTATFFVFRHGETDWNRETRYQGHTDIPLNDQGRLQAGILKERLSVMNLQAMLTSDLKRAQETAQIVCAGSEMPFFISKALRERKIGEPEGLLRDDIIQRFGELAWSQWTSIKKEDQDFCYPQGESKRKVLERMVDYLESFALEHPEFSCIGLSTHGGCLRSIVHYCEEAPTEAVKMPNCALYKISFDRVSLLWKFLT